MSDGRSGDKTPIEEALIICIAFMDRSHLRPVAITISQDRYDELEFNLGTKAFRDTDGDIAVFFGQNPDQAPVKVLKATSS